MVGQYRQVLWYFLVGSRLVWFGKKNIRIGMPEAVTEAMGRRHQITGEVCRGNSVVLRNDDEGIAVKTRERWGSIRSGDNTFFYPCGDGVSILFAI